MLMKNKIQYNTEMFYLLGLQKPPKSVECRRF